MFQIQCFKSFAGGIAQQKHPPNPGKKKKRVLQVSQSSVEGPNLGSRSGAGVFGSENPDFYKGQFDKSFVGLAGNQVWNLV